MQKEYPWTGRGITVKENGRRAAVISLVFLFMVLVVSSSVSHASGEAFLPEEALSLSPWELRSCCEIPHGLVPAEGGLTMSETMVLLAVEAVLNTVDDVLSTQRDRLTERTGLDGQTRLRLTGALEKARQELADQKRALGRSGALTRNLRDADRLIRMELAISRKMGPRVRGQDAGALNKRLDAISARLEKARADHRRLLAGLEGR